MTPRYGPPPHHEYPHPPTRLYEQSRGLDDDFAPGMLRCEPAGFMNGDQVEVRIRGNIWIVGFLVSSLHFISSYLGQGYDVEYKDLRSGQAFRNTFPVQDVRPIVR